MIILASTTDLLQVVTSAAVAINVHASYLDNLSGSVTPGRQNTRISSVATTAVLSSPAASTFRNLKTLHVYNAGAANNTIAVQHTDGVTAVQLYQTLLAPGQTLQYVDEIGFLVSTLAPVLGQYVESDVELGSELALTNNVVANLTGFNLTPGDWDVSLNSTYDLTGTTAIRMTRSTISTTSATEDITNGRVAASGSQGSGYYNSCNVPPVRFNLAATTAFYATAMCTGATGNVFVFGLLRARGL